METKHINWIAKIKDPQLKDEAFTHRSYLNESDAPIHSNERLEFLGDAVLELIVSDYLFHSYPDYPEGLLTLIRSSIVRTETLATIAKKMQMGTFLKVSKGEEENNGRENITILANTYEAFLGALYVSSGMETATLFVKDTLFPIIKSIVESNTYVDPKSKLQEIIQEEERITPTYKIVQEEGPDHKKVFTVAVYKGLTQIGIGTGKSKQEAESKAAQDALLKQKA
jgi:ribonuclease-3